MIFVRTTFCCSSKTSNKTELDISMALISSTPVISIYTNMISSSYSFPMNSMLTCLRMILLKDHLFKLFFGKASQGHWWQGFPEKRPLRSPSSEWPCKSEGRISKATSLFRFFTTSSGLLESGKRERHASLFWFYVNAYVARRSWALKAVLRRVDVDPRRGFRRRDARLTWVLASCWRWRRPWPKSGLRAFSRFSLTELFRGDPTRPSSKKWSGFHNDLEILIQFFCHK